MVSLPVVNSLKKKELVKKTVAKKRSFMDEDSDDLFESPPRAAKSVVAAPSSKFPVPPAPLSMLSRDQLVSYSRALLAFITGGQFSGQGECEMWKQPVPLSVLSSKTRKAMKLEVWAEEMCLDHVRSWNPGMRIGSRFKAGPGKNCSLWKIPMGWVPYLRCIVEVISWALRFFSRASCTDSSDICG